MVSVCEILDLSINLSDHAPVRVICQCTVANSRGVTDDRPNVGNDTTSVAHLRWDYADLSLHRECTGYHLQPILIF